MESVKKKKNYNGSQSSIVTFKNKTTMHCYASGKATIEKKKVPLSVMLWSVCWGLRTSWANAQYTHQHTWQLLLLLLLLLTRENSQVHICMSVAILVGQRRHFPKNKCLLRTPLPLQENRSSLFYSHQCLWKSSL